MKKLLLLSASMACLHIASAQYSGKQPASAQKGIFPLEQKFTDKIKKTVKSQSVGYHVASGNFHVRLNPTQVVYDSLSTYWGRHGQSDHIHG